MQTGEIKKKGGTRKNAGAKPKYNEQTITFRNISHLRYLQWTISQYLSSDIATNNIFPNGYKDAYNANSRTLIIYNVDKRHKHKIFKILYSSSVIYL